MKTSIEVLKHFARTQKLSGKSIMESLVASLIFLVCAELYQIYFDSDDHYVNCEMTLVRRISDESVIEKTKINCTTKVQI